MRSPDAQVIDQIIDTVPSRYRSQKSAKEQAT